MGDVRPALYYPYIHIRSEDWLKATLLCVPVVKRILPPDYEPEDSPTIARYTKIKGPAGLLLQPTPSASDKTDAAQTRLLKQLKAHATSIRARFRRERAPQPDEYWIHDAKFNSRLLKYLRKHELAWESPDPHAHGHRRWFALHPVLGSAIMTTIGLAIARAEDFDIVTPTSRFHDSLLAVREEDVFDALIREGRRAASSAGATTFHTSVQTRHDLGQLVITLAGVNFQTLKAEAIPDLQQSPNFLAFQQLVRGAASHVVRDEGPRAYERELKEQAEKIVDAWHKAGEGLGKKIRAAVFEQSTKVIAPAIPFLPLTGELGGPANVVSLAAAGTVAVALATWKIAGLVSEHGSGPYRYLTEVNRAQDESLRLMFPLGLGR